MVISRCSREKRSRKQTMRKSAGKLWRSRAPPSELLFLRPAQNLPDSSNLKRQKFHRTGFETQLTAHVGSRASSFLRIPYSLHHTLAALENACHSLPFRPQAVARLDPPPCIPTSLNRLRIRGQSERCDCESLGRPVQGDINCWTCPLKRRSGHWRSIEKSWGTNWQSRLVC